MAAGADVYGPVTQAALLGRLGIELRLQRLLERASPSKRAALTSGCARLVDPDAMGQLFKALVVAGPGRPAAAGAATPRRGGDDAAVVRVAGLPGVRHGFFTRQGGVSEACWASLNVGLRSGDDAGAGGREPRARRRGPGW